MNRQRIHLGALAAAFTLVAGAAQALTIGVLFDDTDDGAVSAPFVGSATLTLDGFIGNAVVIDPSLEPLGGVQARGDDPLADGIYSLGDFQTVAFEADFGGAIFTIDDLQSPLSETLVEISTTPDGRTFGFDTLAESITLGTDFINEAQNILSFEPTFGGRYFAESAFEFVQVPGPIDDRSLTARNGLEFDYFGNFGPASQSSEIPVPAALPLMALGLAALGAAARRRRS